MALIRVIEIENFRAIKSIRWLPGPGVNCLIGPGDSGKSTLLDAIDLCLSARRSLTFTDADFHGLDYEAPIRIAITLGALEQPLKSIDPYGDFLVGFNAATGTIEPEPGAGLDAALTLELRVESDLEPAWTLISPRAVVAGRTRNLNWADRTRLSPTRLGGTSEVNLTWRKGSVLNKISEERADASKEMASAARDLRTAFSEKETKELEEPLALITKTAKDLGVPVGDTVRALIDAGTVTFTGGSISLHDEAGVPLRALGLGSTRLLIAGLQREASQRAPIILVDELEHGLEPHRIIRLLSALGAKEAAPPLQVFMTTHSPVAVVELSADQLYIVRSDADRHSAFRASDAGDVQGTIRSQPHALLAASIVVCEGASEIGLLRGLDQHFGPLGEIPLAASGATLVNGNGDETYPRALALQSLGYRIAILRDSDKPAPGALEAQFTAAGGRVFAWTGNRALEQELFLSLPDAAAMQLLELAIEVKDRHLIEAHIKTASKEATTLLHIEADYVVDGFDEDARCLMGDAAARFNWLKTVSTMERAGREIVGPAFNDAEAALTNILYDLFDWIEDA